MNIDGHAFWVSGGASGLGAATARALAAAGGKVVIADLNREAGEALAAELGRAAHFVAVDVTDAASVTQGLGESTPLVGGLHGAINCAGIAIAEKVLGRRGPHDLARFARVVQVNLIGTFNVIRLAATVMAAGQPTASGERGVIVNTASIAAFEGQIGQAAYAASKGGVAALTLPLARELAQHGIRVVAIAPGIFDTPMLGSVPDAVRATLGQQAPFPPRLGQPTEFAALVKHIIENEMLNGAILRLDGALRMQAT